MPFGSFSHLRRAQIINSSNVAASLGLSFSRRIKYSSAVSAVHSSNGPPQAPREPFSGVVDELPAISSDEVRELVAGNTAVAQSLLGKQQQGNGKRAKKKIRREIERFRARTKLNCARLAALQHAPDLAYGRNIAFHDKAVADRRGSRYQAGNLRSGARNGSSVSVGSQLSHSTNDNSLKEAARHRVPPLLGDGSIGYAQQYQSSGFEFLVFGDGESGSQKIRNATSHLQPGRFYWSQFLCQACQAQYRRRGNVTLHHQAELQLLLHRCRWLLMLSCGLEIAPLFRIRMPLPPCASFVSKLGDQRFSLLRC